MPVVALVAAALAAVVWRSVSRKAPLLRRNFHALSALIAVIAFASGCSDRCDDLQLVCDRCVDPFQLASCEAIVDVGSADACDVALEELEKICD